jgi:hypothetical protein
LKIKTKRDPSPASAASGWRVRGARADEDDLGDGWGLEELGAEGAGGVAGRFLGQARDLRCGEGDGVKVAAAGVGILAVARADFFGEIHEDLPEAWLAAEGARDFSQRVGLGRRFWRDAQGMARGRAAGFQDYFGAVGGAEGARGIGVGIFCQNFGERGGVRLESLPPITEGMEDDGAGAENLLYARGIFSGDLDDHIHQFRGAESLADQRAHAEVFGFFFGVFYGDGFGKRHSINLVESSRPLLASRDRGGFGEGEMQWHLRPETG